MSKGLEALKDIKECLFWSDEGLQKINIIEKELKQAKEDRKVLSIFKNALTIEHHEYPMVEHNDSEDVMSYFVKELYTIRQNELEKDVRKALREWVLKNAFPKELKALEIIRKNFTITERRQVQHKNLWNLTQEEYDLLKEVLL